MNRTALPAALAALFVGGAVIPMIRAESHVAGMSTDFWAGFLLSCALALLILAVVLAITGSEEARPAGKNAGMTGGGKRG